MDFQNDNTEDDVKRISNKLEIYTMAEEFFNRDSSKIMPYIFSFYQKRLLSSDVCIEKYVNPNFRRTLTLRSPFVKSLISSFELSFEIKNINFRTFEFIIKSFRSFYEYRIPFEIIRHEEYDRNNIIKISIEKIKFKNIYLASHIVNVNPNDCQERKDIIKEDIIHLLRIIGHDSI